MTPHAQPAWSTPLRRLLPALLALTLAAPLVGAPTASTPTAEVTARDGDAAFDAAYFAAPGFAGTPTVVRLEAAPGADSPPAAVVAAGHYSARWTATLTPRQSGVFSFHLRATAAATLSVDGQPLLRRAAQRSEFSRPTSGDLTLEQNKPYELILEVADMPADGRIALEWTARAASIANAGAAQKDRHVDDVVVELPAGTAIGEATTLTNAHYAIESAADGAFVVIERSTGTRVNFVPAFAIVCQTAGQESKMDPTGAKFVGTPPVGRTGYLVASWNKETDYLVAAHPRTRLRPTLVRRDGDRLRWEFPTQAGYRFAAELDLPADGSEPRIRFSLHALTAAQFSVGYVGAPALASDQTAWIWQPLIWQGHRFPNASYLTREFQCPIPFAMMGLGNVAVGVGADAAEMPFRMPTAADSRFGITIRNASGEAQPILFAPVLGGVESKLAAGQDYSFCLRLLARQGRWFDGYKHLAETLYQFGDARENATCSLNTTIENLTEFFLNDRFCYWYPDQKAWGYQNDAGPGTGRQQSAADPLALALVLDRSDVLERRARPTLEFLLSRRNTFVRFSDPAFMGLHPAYPSDLAAADWVTGGRNPVLRTLLLTALQSAPTGTHAGAADRTQLELSLAAYRITGDRTWLARASAAADRHIAVRINRPPENFADAASSFWPYLAPAYDLLYELYTDTGNPRYLAAAAKAMGEFTAFTYLVPVIPSGSFTANPGGIYNGQPVPEEIVPAWRVAANGLAPECAATSHSHRGVFMASYAAYLARLGADVQEPFFTNIARSAVVGRYANYPSYAYRNGYTTLHQHADYPLRPFEEIKKFTSAHYNHPLPMTAFLVDYLVADTYARSGGHISFPSDFTNSGAYFRNRVYGAEPGQFYDATDACLWLPKALVTTDSVQLNYVAARGKTKFYLAFVNQSARPVTATFTLDPKRVRLAGTHHARVWQDNVEAGTAEIVDGSAACTVSPKGITALAIDDATCVTEIQDAMLDPSVPTLPENSSVTTSTPFGEATATAMRFGRGLTTVHVWLAAGPNAVRQATLRTTSGTERKTLTNDHYPFEFTVNVPDDAKSCDAVVEALLADGTTKSASLSVPLQATVSKHTPAR